MVYSPKEYHRIMKISEIQLWAPWINFKHVKFERGKVKIYNYWQTDIFIKLKNTLFRDTQVYGKKKIILVNNEDKTQVSVYSDGKDRSKM